MKIIVDVMGGDNAPKETVKGAIAASKELDAQLVLVGDSEAIEAIAKEEQFDLSSVEVVHASEVVTMEDDPIRVIRAKKQSSMVLGLQMLAEGKGDAFVSTGNTGALFTGATLIVRKVKGVHRAGIGSILPLQNPMLLLDTGANVTVTEEDLELFGVMGSAYMKKMYGLKNPRVGLLNNGTEECKGTALQQAAYKRLRESDEICFVGNVEGSAMPFGACDVLVTDGFTGNILLKSVEGTGKYMLKQLKGVFLGSLLSKLSYLGVKKGLHAMRKDLDPSEQGGAPILGISKPVIKAHGSSDAKAFKNAIRQAASFAQSGAVDEISRAMLSYEEKRRAAKAVQNSAE